jgi:hypothetical protein
VNGDNKLSAAQALLDFLDKGLLLLSSAITTRPLHNKMHTAVQQFMVQK